MKVIYREGIVETNSDFINGKIILKTKEQLERHGRNEESKTYHQLKAQMGIGPPKAKWIYRLPGGKPNDEMDDLTPWNMHLPDYCDEEGGDLRLDECNGIRDDAGESFYDTWDYEN